MKAAVITRHAISNYGSLLQTMATQHLIEEFGHKCEIIDYIREDEAYNRYEKTLLKNKSRWNSSPVRRWLYLLMRQPESVIAGKYFEKARKRFLHLSDRYDNAEQLRTNPTKADVYVTGSDQVWGPVADGTYDDAYFLSFVQGRKIAYGASFGRGALARDTMTECAGRIQESSGERGELTYGAGFERGELACDTMTECAGRIQESSGERGELTHGAGFGRGELARDTMTECAGRIQESSGERGELTSKIGERLVRCLSEYEGIAVREDSAVQLLDKVGIEARQVLDPTMAVEPEFWDEVIAGDEKKNRAEKNRAEKNRAEKNRAEKNLTEKNRAEKNQAENNRLKNNRVKNRGGYVLVYQLHNDRRLGEYAKSVAKAKGLPLIRVSVSLHQIARPGRLKWCPDVGEFLSYVRNADCLITDSFHGTAFALIFNTPFVEVLPNNGTGTRNMSILRLTGLTGRVLSDNQCTETMSELQSGSTGCVLSGDMQKCNDDTSGVVLADEPIDWDSVNKIIDEQRQRSREIFRELLGYDS